MMEHRLIERMLRAVQHDLEEAAAGNRLDPSRVAVVVDFIRTYADRTHHGKEEDILFAELDLRDLSDEDRRVMDELTADHVYGRRLTGELAEANERYRLGDADALTAVVARLRALRDLYPAHIETEDKVFFPAARTYFTDEEDARLLARFREFDGATVHERYATVVEELERWS
jgi:hemerythrin-like domain-containing protein